MEMAASGALITEEDARRLSRQLFPLGDQWEDLCDELALAGYGLPAAVFRQAYQDLAQTEERRQSLRSYWGEYAKERLAALMGPMDIERGKLPAIAAYRSEFLARLRADAAAGKLKSEGPIISPQIEPTIKRFVEMMPDDPVRKQLNDRTKQARQQAASSLGFDEKPEFAQLGPTDRNRLLMERYVSVLEPAGFTLDSHRKTGLVFRKLTSDGRWAFLFVDDSVDDVRFGTLSTRFALTLPGKAVLPRALPLSAVATFSPHDIVPCFVAANGFANGSYAEFCLAADTNSFLAQTVYSRIDSLLAGEKVGSPCLP
jgi:hypothetical protein